MQVQIHTDHHIEGTDAMSKWVSSAVQEALARFSGQISRVEVHLSDENGGKKQVLKTSSACWRPGLMGISRWLSNTMLPT